MNVLCRVHVCVCVSPFVTDEIDIIISPDSDHNNNNSDYYYSFFKIIIIIIF